MSLVLTPALYKALQAMSLACDKTSIKAYATVVGYDAGYLAVTDGYGMLLYNNPDIEGRGSLDPKTAFCASSVTFPKFSSSIPVESAARQVDLNSILTIVRALRASKPKNGGLCLAISDSDIALRSAQLPGAAVFDPWLILKMLRGIPRDELCAGTARLTGDSSSCSLVLEFGRYTVQIMSLHNN